MQALPPNPENTEWSLSNVLFPGAIRFGNALLAAVFFHGTSAA